MFRRKIWISQLFESIRKEKAGRRRFTRDTISGFDIKGDNLSEVNKPVQLNFFYFIVILIIFGFLGRLFILTVVHGQDNRVKANENRIRLVEVEAERGNILDRK